MDDSVDDSVGGTEIGTEIVVIGGGGAPSRAAADALPSDATVIAADSGLDHAHALGLDVAVAVGDMDSVDPAMLDAATRAGTRIDRHPEAKDATDLELAVDEALSRRPRRLVVVTGAGDRLDHTLAVVLLLAAPRLAAVTVEGWIGPARLTVVRSLGTLRGRLGDLVTLLAVHGPATGVTTHGLLYPLDDEDLDPGSSRGVSNELAATDATVRVRAGVVVAVQPGSAGTHWRRRAEAGD
ncbi:MAG: thiamine diphosphokinase [Acidimicrobiales bacterium]